ncbi:DUF434 domain-containing protein [Desulfitobacterium sp. THU1]|uniref:DUF434 domain-containing protein n=1 Tax=Desulfitobacterium sp. THU1 TaxID=3138072 RepID=UPI00311E22D9
MSSSTKQRGFDPEDKRWFSVKAVANLKIALQEIQWLLDRGYKEGPVVTFVGNHYQFSLRQRNALKRASCTKLQAQRRKLAQLPYQAANERSLIIDGFNLIIALEVALSGGPLILGADGVLRDLAGVSGSYRIIEQTDRALEILGQAFKRLAVPKAKFLLDAPISNSGQLKHRILNHAHNWLTDVEVELVPNADVVLSKMERVITGDSVILDQCQSWINLSREIVERDIQSAWIVSLCDGPCL